MQYVYKTHETSLSIKEKLFLLIALLYSAYMFFPLFADIIRFPVWAPSLCSVILMILLYPKAFINKTFFWFITYAFVLFVYLLWGKPLTIGIGTVADNKKIVIEFAYILPSIGLLCIFLYKRNMSLFKKYIYGVTVLLFISFVTTYPLLEEYGSLRRALGEQTDELKIQGLPGYSLMHAYTLFLPPACFAFRRCNGFPKLLCLFGIGILCVIINSTSITTSIILMVFIIVYTVIYSKSKGINLMLSIILFIAIYFMFETGFFITLIDMVVPYFEGTPVEGKLIDIQNTIVQRELTGGNLTTRHELHMISWHSFLQNPLWGTSVVGGHSSLLDRFGGMGIFAGLPYVMILVSLIKHIYRYLYTQHARSFYMLGVLTGLVYLYEKGNWGAEAWLVYMVFFPISIIVIEGVDALRN